MPTNEPRAADPLPKHLRGRGSIGGPLSGAYIAFVLSSYYIDGGGIIWMAFEAPCDLVVDRISIFADGSEPTLDLDFFHNATPVASGATYLTAINFDASDATGGLTIGNEAGDDAAFVSAAAREVPKGNWVVVAEGATTPGPANSNVWNFVFTCHTVGHVNTDEADDAT